MNFSSKGQRLSQEQEHKKSTESERGDENSELIRPGIREFESNALVDALLVVRKNRAKSLPPDFPCSIVVFD